MEGLIERVVKALTPYDPEKVILPLDNFLWWRDNRAST